MIADCDPHSRTTEHIDSCWQCTSTISARLSKSRPFTAFPDRAPESGATELAEDALRAKEDGHRGSWLTLNLRLNLHQRNHDDQAHYRIDRFG